MGGYFQGRFLSTGPHFLPLGDEGIYSKSFICMPLLGQKKTANSYFSSVLFDLSGSGHRHAGDISTLPDESSV